MDAAMSNRTLEGRVALVTGAGGGVGRGIALALAAAGAKVTIAARRAATGDETAELIRKEGGSALSVQTDVARREEVERAVARTVETYGALDIMIHNASSGLSGMPAQLGEISAQAWTSSWPWAWTAACTVPRPRLRTSSAAATGATSA